jgi:hypothetical protein
MPEKIQNKYLCQLHELDITTKLKILDLKPSIFHKLRSKNSGVAKNIIEFSALILAIKEVIDGYDETSLNAMKLNISRKSASKRDKLLGYWSIVCFLKLGESNTMSFRDIQKYLKKHHRFNISHVSIQQTWNEIEKNKENENE